MSTLPAAAAARSLLLLATDFPPARGGIQTLTAEIYSRLADITRRAVAPAAQDATAFAALPLTRTAAPLGPNLALLRYLRQAAAVLAPECTPPCLVHCNHLFAAYGAHRLQRRTGARYLVWAHGEEITKCRFPARARGALAGAAAILVNSDFTAARVRDLVGHRTPPLHKITLGATPAWARLPLAPAARAAGEPPVILTVARLCARDRYKGLDHALRACAELRRRGVAFRYRIVGEGDDRAALEALARSLGLAGAVEFCGALPEPALLAAYDACDVFLLASREERQRRGLGFEGFGIVLLEAAARGKPVVAGRSGGIPDAVVEGVTGLLVDPASPPAIADGLARLLSDPPWASSLGQAGRQRVLAEYNWDHAAAQVRALHQELLP